MEKVVCYRLTPKLTPKLIDFALDIALTPPALDESKFYTLLGNVIAHEIAHIPGHGTEQEEHEEGGLMDFMGLETANNNFEPVTIGRLRSPESWRSD